MRWEHSAEEGALLVLATFACDRSVILAALVVLILAHDVPLVFA